MKKAVSLGEGQEVVTKMMIGTEGTAFPAHTASHESVLVVVEGTCTITFPDAVHALRTGDTFIVPADEVHHVVGQPDFKAVHIMPKDIHFDFEV